jgi:signal transduction histidine kinase
MAFAFCITVVYFYDYRRSFIIPLLFILLDIGELLFFQELRYSPITERIASNLERISYTAVSLNFYIFVISNFFSTKLGHLISKFKEKEQKIIQTKKEEEESLQRLQNEYKKIENTVTTNSHKLRAPISRIQGLLSLQQAELEDDEKLSDEETIVLKEELKKSLVELRGELEAFEQTIRNAENERTTSYQELIDESIDFDEERFKEDDNLFS